MKFLKNYPVNTLKNIAMMMLIAFTFASCKKDKEDIIAPPVSPAVGKWSGSFTFEGFPIGSLNIVVKQDGTLEAQNTNGQKIGEGSWQLGGSSGVLFTCSYITNSATPLKYNLTGSMETPVKMTGSFGTGNSSYNGGFWNAVKQ